MVQSSLVLSKASECHEVDQERLWKLLLERTQIPYSESIVPIKKHLILADQYASLVATLQDVYTSASLDLLACQVGYHDITEQHHNLLGWLGTLPLCSVDHQRALDMNSNNFFWLASALIIDHQRFPALSNQAEERLASLQAVISAGNSAKVAAAHGEQSRVDTFQSTITERLTHLSSSVEDAKHVLGVVQQRLRFMTGC
jgi:hypothetical protein